MSHERSPLDLNRLNRLLAKIWLSIVFPIFTALYQEASLCFVPVSELTLAVECNALLKDNTPIIFFRLGGNPTVIVEDKSKNDSV
jgi:hypothetical protein